MDRRQLRWSNAPETSADLCFHPGRRLALLPSNGDTRVARIHDSTVGGTDGLRGNVVAYSLHQVHLTTESNPYVERIIGSIRRECLDHVIVLNEEHLRRILRDYFYYYHTCRTHLSLNKDSPNPRVVETAELGNIIELRRVGGLHHLYTRIAA